MGSISEYIHLFPVVISMRLSYLKHIYHAVNQYSNFIDNPTGLQEEASGGTDILGTLQYL